MTFSRIFALATVVPLLALPAGATAAQTPPQEALIDRDQGIKIQIAQSAKVNAVEVSPSPAVAGSTVTISGVCPHQTESARVWYALPEDGEELGATNDLTTDQQGQVSAAVAVDEDTAAGNYQAMLQCTSDIPPGQTQFTVSTSSSGTAGGAIEDNSTRLVLVGGGVLAAIALGGAIYLQRRGI